VAELHSRATAATVELLSHAPVLAAELCSRSRPPAANPAAAVCVLVIGGGATWFTAATLGVDQFGSARDKDAFFNWYFLSLYGSFLLGDTAIVYPQDSVSWALGFGICLAATVGSLAMLLLGARYYRMPAPEGNNPYTELARAVVAAVRKARVDVDVLGRVHYHAGDGAAADYGTEVLRATRCGIF
jgi:peptide/histidine transporter 3/4